MWGEARCVADASTNSFGLPLRIAARRFIELPDVAAMRTFQMGDSKRENSPEGRPWGRLGRPDVAATSATSATSQASRLAPTNTASRQSFVVDDVRHFLLS